MEREVKIIGKKIMKIVLIGMEENIYLREVLLNFFKRGHTLDAIILEKGTPRSEAMIGYLKNDFYESPAFAELVQGKGIPFYVVKNLNGEDTKELLQKYAPDIVMLGGSSRILKADIITTAKTGIINCHPGLLPEYKGRDIVGWAIYNRDPIGVTCHFIDASVDSGPILIRREGEKPHKETLLQVRIRMMRLAAKLMVESVEGLMSGSIKSQPQTSGGTTYESMSGGILKEVEKILEDK